MQKLKLVSAPLQNWTRENIYQNECVRATSHDILGKTGDCKSLYSKLF